MLPAASWVEMKVELKPCVWQKKKGKGYKAERLVWFVSPLRPTATERRPAVFARVVVGIIQPNRVNLVDRALNPSVSQLLTLSTRRESHKNR